VRQEREKRRPRQPTKAKKEARLLEEEGKPKGKLSEEVEEEGAWLCAPLEQF